MAAVMIGVDPHKGSHTAVAIGAAEEPLGELRVRAAAVRPSGWWRGRRRGRSGPGRSRAPAAWVTCWPSSWSPPASGSWTCSPSSAPGCGCWRPGTTNKNDPNDARSVAIAALRSAARREVAAEDHAAVLKVWSKRHRDLGRPATRSPAGCTPCSASWSPAASPRRSPQLTLPACPGRLEPSGPVALARAELAAEFLEDLRRIDAQMRDTKKKLAAAVRASGTTLTEVFGVGPVIAATVIGDVTDVSRFASRDHFAAYNGTAPIEVSSGNRKIYRLSRRGNRRLNHAIHMAAVTQIRYRHSDGRAYYDRKIAEGKTPKKRSGPSSGGSATPSSPACRPTPGRPQPRQPRRAREGNRGTTLSPARPAHTPNTGSSAKPLPSPPPPYDPPPRSPPKTPKKKTRVF